MSAKQDNAKRAFDDLKRRIQETEATHREFAIQVFEQESPIAVASVRRPMRRAILRRLVLRAKSGEIWAELGEGSWNKGSLPWDFDTMDARVESLPRENLPKVEFVEVDL
ncbi:hypothetical protein [Cupriavidus campinensis]|uniref:Uncharacterized protein n=1 Tax=Cupriavidus campinensis TaxID=151783 RepID=A0ABY3ETN2_9BURK|nr:hypothetical protein [Cupriavidus campinensis]TSP13928.1 hypothetical protein FGG12_05480 [Cupriavidus campinensis]